jgi:hypothetical protein
MVKKNQHFFSLFTSKISEKEILYKKFLMVLLIEIISIALLNMFKTMLVYGDSLKVFLTVLIALPILLLIVVGLFSLFVHAFQNRKDNTNIVKTVIYTSTILLPSFIIGHLLNLINTYFENLTLEYIFGFSIILVLLVNIILVLKQTKHLTKTTYPKVIVSLLLTIVTLLVFTLGFLMLQRILNN